MKIVASSRSRERAPLPMARAGLVILDPAGLMQNGGVGAAALQPPATIEAVFAHAAVLMHLMKGDDSP